MNQIAKIYVYGQWHIALSALSLFAGITLYFGSVVSIALAIHIFSSTMFIYLLHRFYSRKIMSAPEGNRYGFLDEHQRDAFYSLILSGLAVLVSFVFLTVNVQLYILALGIISLAYVLPLLSKRLRDLEGAKIIFIAAVWAAVCLAGIFDHLSILAIALIFIQQFSFIFSLTIPFDVRDIDLDSQAQVSNLNEFISLKSLSRLILFLIGTSLSCALLLYSLGFYDISVVVLLTLFYIVQGVLTIDLKKAHSEYFYLLILDGLICVKGLLYISASTF